MLCDRCGATTLSTIMSRFNTEALCDACEAAEQRHPDYAKAVAVEAAALLAGDPNFPGIGFDKNRSA